jgi:hypothetical protein
MPHSPLHEGSTCPVSSPSSWRRSSSTCLSIASVMALSAPRLVLVDHRGALRVVAHARHEIAPPAPLLAANWLLVCAGRGSAALACRWPRLRAATQARRRPGSSTGPGIPEGLLSAISSRLDSLSTLIPNCLNPVALSSSRSIRVSSMSFMQREVKRFPAEFHIWGLLPAKTQQPSQRDRNSGRNSRPYGPNIETRPTGSARPRVAS